MGKADGLVEVDEITEIGNRNAATVLDCWIVEVPGRLLLSSNDNETTEGLYELVETIFEKMLD